MALVKIDSRKLAQLERAELERDDYLKAARLMRPITLEWAAVKTPFAAGWIAGQQSSAAALLTIMGERALMEESK